MTNKPNDCHSQSFFTNGRRGGFGIIITTLCHGNVIMRYEREREKESGTGPERPQVGSSEEKEVERRK